MQALGRQILVEYYNSNQQLLNDTVFVENTMNEAAEVAGATIIKSVFHKFSPHGVSGVIVIAESHLAIHTWPEYGYAAVDIFTCGETIEPWLAFNYIKEKFQSQWVSRMELRRGQFESMPQDAVLKHKP